MDMIHDDGDLEYGNTCDHDIMHVADLHLMLMVSSVDIFEESRLCMEICYNIKVLGFICILF